MCSWGMSFRSSGYSLGNFRAIVSLEVKDRQIIAQAWTEHGPAIVPDIKHILTCYLDNVEHF